MFDAQRAERDDGVLECNRSARRVREMPSKFDLEVYEVPDSLQEVL